jgi:hypothetical protein
VLASKVVSLSNEEASPNAWLVSALAAALPEMTLQERQRVRELMRPEVDALGVQDLTPLLEMLVSNKDAGIGAVAGMAVSATGKQAMALVRSRRSRHRPSEVQVKSTARWAINMRWPDAEVSRNAVFLEEVYSPTGWRLVLADANWLYADERRVGGRRSSHSGSTADAA